MNGAVHEGLLAERERLTSDPCAIAADLHLAGDQASRRRLAALIECCRQEGADLYLLGDVFETWLGKRQLQLSTYDAEIALFESATSTGVRVILVPGNRDFLLDESFCAATGVLLGRDSIELVSAGGRLLLSHGDLFSTSDVAYQRLRRLLRSPFFRFLTGILPTIALAALARRLRRHSRAAVLAKNPTTLAPDVDRVGELIDEGFDQVVCGHFHQSRDEEVSGKQRSGRFVVLEPFEERGSYRWGEGGKWSERRVAGEAQ